MTYPKKSDGERNSTIVGILGTVAAVLAAIGEATERLVKLHESIALVPDPAVWGVILLLFGVSIRLAWHGMSSKSRLTKSIPTFIDKDNPLHLKGRQKDIRRILDLVESARVLFLLGESGSGKTALLNSGVIPALKSSPTRLEIPIYFASYGRNWETDLENALVNKVWVALDETTRNALSLSSRSDVQDYLGFGARGHTGAVSHAKSLGFSSKNLLEHLKHNLGIKIVAIFDQFDDYQIQNRGNFSNGDAPISVKELTKRNRFWRYVSRWIESDLIVAVFATRTDAAYALHSVSFETPKYHILSRVDASHIVGLFGDLLESPDATEPAIQSPMSGWLRLREVLISDLTHPGGILPMQAQVVLRGLAKLPYLGVHPYRKIGGIEGLESLVVADSLAKASQNNRIDMASMVNTLTKLVNNTESGPPRTLPVPTKELLSSTPGEQRKRFLDALSMLENDHIVRRHAPDEERDADGDRWSLYHDYLARSILTLREKENRWQRHLEEEERSWRHADTAAKKWSCLLPPLTLLRIPYLLARGRIRSAGLRAFFGWSLLRTAPHLAVILIAFLMHNMVLSWQAEKSGDAILLSIRSTDTEYSLEPLEFDQYWKIAAGPKRLKSHVSEEIVRAPHASYDDRLEILLQSIVGVDIRGNNVEMMIGQVADLLGSASVDCAHAIYLGRLVCVLAKNNTKRLARRCCILCIDCMMHSDPEEIGSLVPDEFVDLCDKLAHEDLAAVKKHLLRRHQDVPLEEIPRLLQIMEAMPAASAETPLRKFLRNFTPGAGRAAALSPERAAILGDLASHSPPEFKQRVLPALVRSAEDCDLGDLCHYVAAIKAFSGSIPTATASAKAHDILRALHHENNYWTARRYCSLIVDIFAWIEESGRRDIFREIFERVGAEDDALRLTGYCQLFLELSAQTMPDNMTEFRENLYQTLSRDAAGHLTKNLLHTLVKFDIAMSTKDASIVAKRIVELLPLSSSSWEFEDLCRLATQVSSRLNTNDAARLCEELAAFLQTESGAREVGAAVSALGDLSRIAGEDCELDVLQSIIGVIRTHRSHDDVARFAGPLKRFVSEVSEQAQVQAFAALAASLGETRDHSQLMVLGTCLARCYEVFLSRGGRARPTDLDNSILKALTDALGVFSLSSHSSEFNRSLVRIAAQCELEDAVTAATALLQANQPRLSPPFFGRSIWQRYNSAIQDLCRNCQPDLLPWLSREIASRSQDSPSAGLNGESCKALVRLAARSPTRWEIGVDVNQIVMDSWKRCTTFSELRDIGGALVEWRSSLTRRELSIAHKKIIFEINKREDPREVASLGVILSGFGSSLAQEDGRSAVQRLSVILNEESTESSDAVAVVEALCALGAESNISIRQRVVAVVVRAMGKFLLPSHFEDMAFQLAPLTVGLEGFASGVVDLLKSPAAFGTAKECLLLALGNIYGRTFSSMAEVVDWAERRGLDLRFDVPPTRPAFVKPKEDY